MHVFSTIVLVLTGNPGVGKHTVSKKLAEILDYEIVDVNKEAVKVGMQKQSDSIDVDVEKTQKMLKDKISDKSLIVGHLAPFVVSKDLVSKVLFLERTLMILFRFMTKETIPIRKKMIILEVRF